LSAKKRVYDIAKEYGMTGQELAAKLRDLGFTQIKSHMTALSDFELLEVQARLEAYGIVGESAAQVTNVGGLKLKRKRKLPGLEGDEGEEAPAAATPPAPVAPPPPPPAPLEVALEPEPEPEAAAEPEPEPEPEPTPARAHASAKVGPAPKTAPAPKAEPRHEPRHEPKHETRHEGRPEPKPEPRHETRPEPRHEPRHEPVVAREPESPAPPGPVELEPELETEPASASASASAAPASSPAAPAATPPATEADGDIVRPSAKRRSGKVVGFIDPAQFKRAQPAKPESRRLRSSDDVVPDVMPTMGRDRKAGVVRGDTTRGTMTAQELRDREQGRFLRRRGRGAPTGAPVGGGGRRDPRRDPANASPLSGGPLAIEAPVTIKKLANTLAVKENQVLQEAMKQVGFGININSIIDIDTAVLLASEFGVQLEVKTEIAAETALIEELAESRKAVGDEKLAKRAPCVAFLGHVDHGKTTLIDTIRHTTIADGEAGGITQHIGAYQVTTQKGHTLSIVDTPGHAAFTAMRARGANAVDIVVLVVAADDGVMPQTEEALNHARAAKTLVVVALNKIDKAGANPERVKSQLAALGLQPEEWGGTTAMLPVSGLKGTGLEELLERVFLESEVLELKSHLEGPASGIVLEAEIQQGKGKVAHLLVQDGCLAKGDVILAGEGYGRVRSIHDDRGKLLDHAGPSMPVEVTGLNELPTVGDRFYVVDSLEKAQEVATERARTSRQLSQIERRTVSHENILQVVADAEKPTINLIVKADKQGSVEVLKHQVGLFLHDEMQINLLHAGVGAVTESDVDLATTSGSRILAFHTSANARVRQMAERGGVEIKIYDVLYDLLEDIKRLMEGELAPEQREEVSGHAEVRRVFKSSKFGNISGCFVIDGSLFRSSQARLLRDSKVVYTGAIGSLRREKDDVREVREGFECGITLKDYDDVREGDVIEAFKVVEIKRTL
jgi:translation initiation factor IF-2